MSNPIPPGADPVWQPMKNYNHRARMSVKHWDSRVGQQIAYTLRWHGMTLGSIGKMIGRSRERVRQMVWRQDRIHGFPLADARAAGAFSVTKK